MVNIFFSLTKMDQDIIYLILQLSFYAFLVKATLEWFR